MSDNQFIKFFRAYTSSGGGGGGGGGGVDIKVKVSGADTTTDYLSNKLSSFDGSVTFTILNPGGNEQYDVSISPIVRTVAQANVDIGANNLKPGRLYYITDAYSNTCQIFLWAVTNNQFDQNGWGLFSNANTASREAFMLYDVVSDVVYEVSIPSINVTIRQSINANTGVANGNALDVFPIDCFEIWNVFIEDSTFLGTGLSSAATNWRFINQKLMNASLTFNDNGIRIFEGNNFQLTAVTANGAGTIQLTSNYMENSVAVMSDDTTILNSFSYAGQIICTGTSSANSCSFYYQSNTNLTSSSITSCSVEQNAVLTLNNNVFNNCKVGMGKTVVPASGYNATNGFLENLDSTFEVFLNPDVAGVMDMNDYKFAGIVRIGTNGVPAAWDLKEIQNFPTDHIFSIIPADANTVDVYDAGAGGTNIYLSTAAVVTYDGAKDDTLVVRSGLNDYARLFQIGGWQAPSA